MGKSITRRQFVTRSAGYTAAALASTAFGPALRTHGESPASERVRLGFIACGRRARELMRVFSQFRDVDVPIISDVLEPRMEALARMLSAPPRPRNPERAVDYRHVLERKDVDAVVIATTEHWHGLPFIHACQAGKDIFIEKPLSHTIVEGRAMVQAANKYGVITMMGTQQRAGEHYKKAVQIVQSGRLGKIALVECWLYHNTANRVGRGPDSEPPPGYHWDLWLGPAPYVPFNPARLSYSWWFDYGGGMMTNWAVHHIDIILWAMGVESPKTSVCTGGKFVVDDISDTPDTMEASWEFPGFVMHFTYRGFNNFHTVQQRPYQHGICFHGNKATMVLDRNGYEIYDDSNPRSPVEKQPESAQDGPWQRTFVDSVKQGRKPPLDLELGHKATVCCLLGNIAYLVGRKVRWDGETEQIIGDEEASRLLGRPRRKGFELPQV